MYALIIAIHAVFATTTYLLGQPLFTGIFVILGIFFLFYFSPLFFLEDSKKEQGAFSFSSIRESFYQFSPKDSLLFPTILLYIALYGFSFSVFWGIYNSLSIHTVIISLIFLLFVGYMLSFYWKHDIFFEIFRFHTLFTLVSTVIFTLSFFLQYNQNPFLHIFTWILWVIAWTFLLSYTRKESTIFLSGYLFALYATTILLFSPLFTSDLLLGILITFTILSFLVFEILPRNKYFFPYTEFFRYFSLIAILVTTPLLIYQVFVSVESTLVFLLSFVTIFFLSVHTRFMNYIVFMVGIINTFILYFLIFSDLIFDPSMSSFFLFTFFLPILLIGTTFFWEEKHPYDFMILHYSSIAFSIIFSIYIIFFVSWGSDLLFVTSLSLFWVALLFFMSYFRFRSLR